MSSSAYLLRKDKYTASLSNTPDNFTIDAESGYGIDVIRNLRKWVLQKPYSEKYKLVLIHNAEKLGIEAQNALLKTLEEPPSDTYIMLTTNNLDRILETVKSRCTKSSLKDLTDKTHHPPIWLERIEILIDPETPASYGLDKVEKMETAFQLAEEISDAFDREATIKLLENEASNILIDHNYLKHAVYKRILTAIEQLSHNTNIRLTLEAMLLNILKNQQ